MQVDKRDNDTHLSVKEQIIVLPLPKYPLKKSLTLRGTTRAMDITLSHELPIF